MLCIGTPTLTGSILRVSKPSLQREESAHDDPESSGCKPDQRAGKSYCKLGKPFLSSRECLKFNSVQLELRAHTRKVSKQVEYKELHSKGC